LQTFEIHAKAGGQRPGQHRLAGARRIFQQYVAFAKQGDNQHLQRFPLADDYLLKPCEPEELSFRISSCIEKLELKRKVSAYETLLPVCCVCKSIRDDAGKDVGAGEWISMEEYLLTKSKIAISPTYCPECINMELESLKILKGSDPDA